MKKKNGEEEKWKRQPFKVKATYMNIYVDILYTNHSEKGDGDSRDLKPVRSTALHTDRG